MTRPPPHVGVPFFEPSGWPDRVHAAGAEPVPLRLPSARPRGGVALSREWVADLTEVVCAEAGLDALLLEAGSPENLFGMLLAAVRLNLPTVCAPPAGTPTGAALVALGLAPPDTGDAARLVATGVPRPPDLLDNFSLANALRAGVAAGGGSEVIVHLSALAREAGVAGFAQMARVLAPETDVRPPEWFTQHGVPALLASLGDGLHDVPTVSGGLKETLPDGMAAPDATRRRLAVLRARASGAEALCVAPVGVSGAAGTCRVFPSEEGAARAVEAGDVREDDLIVVAGCGPRGGPGLLRLDALGEALRERDLRTPVLTDGLAPQDPPGVWASIFAPEAAAGGVIRHLRTGDFLRLDLDAGRIRTEVGAKELRLREPHDVPGRTTSGYAARYARAALPALEGGGFG